MAAVDQRLSDERPAILLSANASWNIVNFRLGLIDALDRAGYRPVVAAPADRHTEVVRRRGYEFHHLPMSRSGMNPAAEAMLLLRYYWLIRKVRPAAFLGFTIKPNIYGSIAARMAGVQRINNVSGLGTTFLQRPLLQHLVSRLYRHAFRGSHRVFFQNPDDRRLFVENGLVDSRQARLLPGSGVDLDHFRPVRTGIGGPPTFLFIGRLLGDKGVREFVDAARLLRRQLTSARFQILGDLDPGNRTGIRQKELQSWIDEGSIEYLGAAEDIRPFVAASTAVVLPSYREGMPRVLLEAAAMARPLVAADVPGCREIVIDGVTGTLCEVRNPRSLAEAMARIAQLRPDERAELGAAALARVRERFSETLVIAEYLAALRDIESR